MNICTINNLECGNILSTVRIPEITEIYTTRLNQLMDNFFNETVNMCGVRDYTEAKNIDILATELPTLSKETMCKTSGLSRHTENMRPKMIYVSSANPWITGTDAMNESRKIIKYWEEEMGYAVASVKYKNQTYHYDKKTFTTSTKYFGSPVDMEQTHIIMYDKDRYMDYIDTIRNTELPQSKMPKLYPSDLQKCLITPIRINEPYICLKDHKNLDKCDVHILNQERWSPKPMSPSTMKEKRVYLVIKDDAWQTSVDTSKLSHGLRFPVKHEYMSILGYSGYALKYDDGVDRYMHKEYVVPHDYVDVVDIKTNEYILKKYTSLLLKISRNINEK